MTEAEKAIKDLCIKCSSYDFCVKGNQLHCAETVAYIKGLAEGKTKWHDLRKNPDDLPEERGDYWIKYDSASEERGGFYDVHYFEPDKPFYKKHWSEIGVIAWCELPKFEE